MKWAQITQKKQQQAQIYESTNLFLYLWLYCYIEFLIQKQYRNSR